jgi:ribose transport system substrate-binding protein
MKHLARLLVIVPVVLVTTLAANLAVTGQPQQAAAIGTRIPGTNRTVHQLRMEVIVKTSNSAYWQIVFAAAKQAAAQFGVQSLGYVGGPSEADINAEISLIEDAIAKHPDFLVIAPTSATALNSAITKAYNAGIKVIIIDSSVTTNSYQSFLATNNVLGGCLAAQGLARAIKAKTGSDTGQVAYATFVSGAGSLAQRDQGFRQCLAHYPGLHIVSHKYAAGDPNVAGHAFTIAATTLTAFPHLVGYWGDNLQTLQGAEKAFQTNHINHNKVSLVGYDNTAQEVTALRNHTLDGTILQDPYMMGYGGVAYGIVAAAGINTPKFLNTGVHFATPANVSSPIIQALLNPMTQRGLGFK